MAASDDPTPEAAIEQLFRARSDDVRIGPVGVAVSGGGDSLALLIAARAFAARHDLPIWAATVDHGLRPEAAEEARQVAQICAARGVPHDILTLRLPDGSGLQARARAARYDALGSWAKSRGIARVLVGHTRDDVVESLVMRLRRGVGLDGLAEMPDWWTDSDLQGWGRPFLTLSRTCLHRYVADHGLDPIADPSNDDTRFERVEVRKALATLGWTDGALARSARHLARAAQSIDARLDAIFDDHFTHETGDLLISRGSIEDLVRAEPDTLRRLAIAAIGAIGDRPPPREPEQTRLLDFMRAPRGGGITLAGCRIVAKHDMIRIFRELAACPPRVALGTWWDNRWYVTGPDAPGLTIGALGVDIDLTPWRDGPIPRASALAHPAVRSGDTLIAAPTVGLSGDYTVDVRCDPRAAFRRRGRFFN
ncbi:tRNA lysidine(34) synthetase TilS [Jannaschia donghaensis]|uniref:tRNA(Ile)-lysidine synthase n=1 Tax=Jannaschia donghaensis TaxID=420998 RepID=A0A0M6YIY9_9RHOB|nr:tRNA lysidine(34) synthetase TilS [Jannaschia donghaensis]CTQ49920.1 tRNA(Ile)-lysidine synthase [Jannaschia donghaensis]